MSQFDSMERGDAIIKASFYSPKHGRNIPVTLRGKIYRFGDEALSTPYHITEAPECQDAAGTGGTEDEKK